MLDLVDELVLSQVLLPAQAKDPRGEKGFDPRMQTKISAKRLTMLLLYAYTWASSPHVYLAAGQRAVGTRSSGPATRIWPSAC